MGHDDVPADEATAAVDDIITAPVDDDVVLPSAAVPVDDDVLPAAPVSAADADVMLPPVDDDMSPEAALTSVTNRRKTRCMLRRENALSHQHGG